MRSWIKKIFPEEILEQFRKKSRKNRFRNKQLKDTFTYIKESKHWTSAESFSGDGSELEVTKVITKKLEDLIKELSIESMLDIPCGDYNWMRFVNKNGLKYIGADIVSSLIEDNIANFTSDTISFQTLDLTKDNLPKSDLIFCRDCLVHLSYKDIYKAIRNLKKSGSTYLLTTSFVNSKPNKDIISGEWRKLNLTLSPFYFDEPIRVLNEEYTLKEGKYIDKSMCLWKIDSLKTPLKLRLYYWLS